MRLSQAQARKIIVAKDLHMTPVQSKYRNVKTMVDGITFASKAEAAYYEKLAESKRVGVIKYFLRQVPFDLPGNTKYRVDFMVVHLDNAIEYIDVKGTETAMFKLKKKQVESLYGVEIICVKRMGSKGYQFRVMP